MFTQIVQQIQNDLIESEIDGWLFYDFCHSNDLACQILQIPENQMLTRRFFYWIPSSGEPIKIVSAIENPLQHLPGLTLKFEGWQTLLLHLKNTLSNATVIAMEYSPNNAVPTVSKVDAGTIEMIKTLGVKIKSSCDLLQKLTSVLSQEQFEMHLKAAFVLDQTVQKTWEMIFECVKNKKNLTDYAVQQFILKEIHAQGCVTKDAPICAINAHSADPHFNPDINNKTSIKENDFILLDLWCKVDHPEAVYADITRVGVAGNHPTKKQQQIFEIVKNARDAATNLVISKFSSNQKLQGFEVDRAARCVITEAGFGSYFIHRTGHNIYTNAHGNGANIDDLETQDLRYLLKNSCFSIEPGIYLPGEFGVRLEYDLFIDQDGKVHITGGIQEKLVCFSNI